MLPLASTGQTAQLLDARFLISGTFLKVPPMKAPTIIENTHGRDSYKLLSYINSFNTYKKPTKHRHVRHLLMVI